MGSAPQEASKEGVTGEHEIWKASFPTVQARNHIACLRLGDLLIGP